MEKIYYCNPSKNNTCKKTACYKAGGECQLTSKEEYKMDINYEIDMNEHEIRTYLKIMYNSMNAEGEGMESFKPTYFITAVKLPTGAIELAVNSVNIKEKIEYILDAYDENMCLKTNPAIVMQNIMVV